MPTFDHMLSALAGATVLGIVAHAVNTFPTPTNKYGAWALGVVQFAVGQRVAASNTFKGLQTAAQGITTEEKAEIIKQQQQQQQQTPNGK